MALCFLPKLDLSLLQDYPGTITRHHCLGSTWEDGQMYPISETFRMQISDFHFWEISLENLTHVHSTGSKTRGACKEIHPIPLPLSHCKKTKTKRGDIGDICNFQGDVVIHTPSNGHKAKGLFLSPCLQVKCFLLCFQCQRSKTGPILWHKHSAPWRLSLACYTCTATGSQLKILPKVEKNSRILSPPFWENENFSQFF